MLKLSTLLPVIALALISGACANGPQLPAAVPSGLETAAETCAALANVPASILKSDTDAGKAARVLADLCEARQAAQDLAAQVARCEEK